MRKNFFFSPTFRIAYLELCFNDHAVHIFAPLIRAREETFITEKKSPESRLYFNIQARKVMTNLGTFL